jgi:hypothetical protein
MDKDGCLGAFICVVIAAALFVGGLTLGMKSSDLRWKNEAVENGAAEYTVDSQGAVGFRWLTRPPEPAQPDQQ